MSVKKMRQHQSRSNGFSLVELLVSLIIFSIGLLGAVSLQVTGMKNNQSAYMRSQASSLAADMADRIRSNSTAALAGGYDDFDTNETSPADPGCTFSSDGCSGAQQATTDFREWSMNFKDVGGDTVNYLAVFPSGRGMISRANSDQFTVSVIWEETDWDGNETNSRSLSSESLILNFRL